MPDIENEVIITVERKKFRPMKNWQKVALGLVAFNLLTRSNQTYQTERCIRVRNMDFPKIPNNGGL